MIRLICQISGWNRNAQATSSTMKEKCYKQTMLAFLYGNPIVHCSLHNNIIFIEQISNDTRPYLFEVTFNCLHLKTKWNHSIPKIKHFSTLPSLLLSNRWIMCALQSCQPQFTVHYLLNILLELHQKHEKRGIFVLLLLLFFFLDNLFLNLKGTSF